MAKFWKRVIAWIVDQLVLAGAIGLPISVLAEIPLEQLAEFLILPTLAYFTILEGATGKSLGKYLMKIRVYQEKGQKAGFARAMLRRIGLLVPFISLADVLAILWTPRKQRIFDLVAGTVVIEESKAAQALAYLRRKDVRALVSELVRPVVEEEVKKIKTMLEGLKQAREELKSQELPESKYRELKLKYDARIQELEERLKALTQRKSRRGEARA